MGFQMRVLFLGPSDSPLIPFLRDAGDETTATADPVDPAVLSRAGHEFLVSYGYRHILRPPVLDLFPGRAVNLHVSLLPWNRGADPNLWSFLEGTPKGVTIHHLDPGVDTGDLIVQREVAPRPGDTLKTSYDRLTESIRALFYENWPAIRSGAAPRRPQPTGGTTHRMKDKDAHAAALPQGWDTPVSAVEAYGRAQGLFRRA